MFCNDGLVDSTTHVCEEPGLVRGLVWASCLHTRPKAAHTPPSSKPSQRSWAPTLVPRCTEQTTCDGSPHVPRLPRQLQLHATLPKFSIGQPRSLPKALSPKPAPHKASSGSPPSCEYTRSTFISCHPLLHSQSADASHSTLVSLGTSFHGPVHSTGYLSSM